MTKFFELLKLIRQHHKQTRDLVSIVLLFFHSDLYILIRACYLFRVSVLLAIQNYLRLVLRYKFKFVYVTIGQIQHQPKIK